VPERYEQVVVESSQQCPGECIFVELEPEPRGAISAPHGGTRVKPA
jgi:hypothetical protein